MTGSTRPAGDRHSRALTVPPAQALLARFRGHGFGVPVSQSGPAFDGMCAVFGSIFPD